MANILGERKMEYFVKEWHLIPSDGGRFEFAVDGQVLFSKKQLGRHAQPDEVETMFRDLVQAYMDEHHIVLPDEDED
jgi:predicted Rdx family selenoprotein